VSPAKRLNRSTCRLRVGTGNRVLDGMGVKIPTSKVVILNGKSGGPLQRRQRTRRSLCRMSCAKTTEPIEMPFGTWIQVGPENHVLDGILISTHKGELLRAKRGQPRTCRTCPAVDIFKATEQEAQPVRCRCRLGCDGMRVGAT